MNKLIRLNTMTDKQIQDWLRKVSAYCDINTLPVALSGANDDIRDCVFRNMSVHAKDLVQKTIQEQNGNGVDESEMQKCVNSLADLF